MESMVVKFFPELCGEQVSSLTSSSFFLLLRSVRKELSRAHALSPTLARLDDLQRLAAPGHGQLRSQGRAVHQPVGPQLGHRRRHHRLDQKGAAAEQSGRGAGERMEEEMEVFYVDVILRSLSTLRAGEWIERKERKRESGTRKR